MSTRPGQVFPDQYDRQLQAKADQLAKEFADLYNPERQGMDVYASPRSHFRMRAEFRLWHDGDRSFFAMFDPAEPKTPIEVPDFPMGSDTINRLMPLLRSAIEADDRLRRRLFQVEFLTTLSGEALVTLIYHRRLDTAWEAAATALSDQLGIRIIGRSRKQRIVLDTDYVTETLTVDGRPFRYRQTENGFIQPNARVCEHMLQWACDQAEKVPDGDLLELYCGLGTFTLPLSRHFRKVLATEIARTSVRAAEHNIAMNQRDNIRVGRMSAEDFAQGWHGGGGRRIAKYDLPAYDFRTVFVDPPRAGLDDRTLELVREFPSILYISCNPETLLRNCQALASTHRIERLAMFDQFPYTHHREAGVLLCRRP